MSIESSKPCRLATVGAYGPDKDAEYHYQFVLLDLSRALADRLPPALGDMMETYFQTMRNSAVYSHGAIRSKRRWRRGCYYMYWMQNGSRCGIARSKEYNLELIPRDSRENGQVV